MRALTLVQPMAWAIVAGSKRIENRTRPLPRWMTGRRTLVAVHAGLKWQDGYADTVQRIMGVQPPPEARASGIVGAMVLSGRQWVANRGAAPTDPWFGGPFGYEIEWAGSLVSPITGVKGLQGFWPLPENVADVVAQLAVDCGVPLGYATEEG